MSPNNEQGRIEKHEHRYAGYEAQDQKGERIGHVDDLFVDTVDQQEYVELNMGFLGLSSTLIPMEICEVDDEQKVVNISQSRTRLRRAPRKKEALLSGDDDVAAITPDYEDRVREYYGPKNVHPPRARGPSGCSPQPLPRGRPRKRDEFPQRARSGLRLRA